MSKTIIIAPHGGEKTHLCWVLEDSWLWNLREPMIDFWQSPLHAFGSLFWVDKAKICLGFLIFTTRGKKSSNKCRPPGGWSGEATFSWHWWCQKGPGCLHTQLNVDSTLFLFLVNFFDATVAQNWNLAFVRILNEDPPLIPALAYEQVFVGIVGGKNVG